MTGTTYPDPSAVSIGTWTLWSIPLSTFSSAGVQIDSVKKTTIGIGDRAQPPSGAAGRLYLDDIRVLPSVWQ